MEGQRKIISGRISKRQSRVSFGFGGAEQDQIRSDIREAEQDQLCFLEGQSRISSGRISKKQSRISSGLGGAEQDQLRLDLEEAEQDQLWFWRCREDSAQVGYFRMVHLTSSLARAAGTKVVMDAYRKPVMVTAAYGVADIIVAVLVQKLTNITCNQLLTHAKNYVLYLPAVYSILQLTTNNSKSGLHASHSVKYLTPTVTRSIS